MPAPGTLDGGGPNTAPPGPDSNPDHKVPDAPDAPEAPDVEAEAESEDIVKLKVVFASLDKNIDAYAREAAHEKAAQKAEGSFFRRFARNAWNGFRREHYIVKGTQDARKAIIENENLREHQGGVDTDLREAAVQRVDEFGEKLIREEAGETYVNLNELINNTDLSELDPDSPEYKRVKDAMRIKDDTLDVVRRYSLHPDDPDYIPDIASLDEELKRMRTGWLEDKVSKELLGEAGLWGTNVIEMAKQGRAAADSQAGLDQLERRSYVDKMIANAEVVTAQTKVGSNVEIDARLSEKLAARAERLNEILAEKLKGKNIISEERLAKVISVLGNELVIAAMLSAATYAGRRGMSAALLIPGLGAAVVGGFRERRVLKDERDLMARRMDNGENPGNGSKRQERIAESMNESAPVSDLIDSLSSFYDSSGNLNVTDEDSFNAAVAALAEIKARQDIELRDGKRLIDYGADMNQRGYRETDLMNAVDKFQTDLDMLAQDKANHAMLNISAAEEFETLLKTHTEIAEGLIKGEISQKDRIFFKATLFHVFERAGKTFVAGEMFRELYDAIQDYINGVAGNGSASAGAGAPDMKPVAEYSDLGSTEGEPIGGNGESYDSSGGNEGPARGESIGEDYAQGGKDAPVRAEPIGADIPTQGEPVGAGFGESIGFEEASQTESIGTEDATTGEPIGADVGEAIGELSEAQTGEPIGSEGGYDSSSGSEDATQGEPIGADVGEDIGGVSEAQTGEAIGTETATEGEPIGADVGEPIGGTGESVTEISKNANIVLPQGFSSEVNGNDITIYGPDGKVLHGQLTEDGQLSQETLNGVEQVMGLQVQDTKVEVDGPIELHNEQVTANQFVENHKNEMKTITRTGHFDDDTPREYKLNEAKYDVIVLPNGDIRLSIARMTADGSFHGDQSVNWREAAKNGDIRAYLSASRGAQGHALEYTFNEQGYVDIPKSSSGGALFDEKGRFVGGFNEVALTGGETPEGATKIMPLATVVGVKGTITDNLYVVGPKVEEHTYTFSGPTQGEPIGESWPATTGNPMGDDGTPIIPIPVPLVRRSLGRGRRRPGARVVRPAAPASTSTGSIGGGSTTGTGTSGPRPGTGPNRTTSPGGPGGPGPGGPGGSSGPGPSGPGSSGPSRPGSVPPPAGGRKKKTRTPAGSGAGSAAGGGTASTGSSSGTGTNPPTGSTTTPPPTGSTTGGSGTTPPPAGSAGTGTGTSSGTGSTGSSGTGTGTGGTTGSASGSTPPPTSGSTGSTGSATGTSSGSASGSTTGTSAGGTGANGSATGTGGASPNAGSFGTAGSSTGSAGSQNTGGSSSSTAGNGGNNTGTVPPAGGAGTTTPPSSGSAGGAASGSSSTNNANFTPPSASTGGSRANNGAYGSSGPRPTNPNSSYTPQEQAILDGIDSEGRSWPGDLDIDVTGLDSRDLKIITRTYHAVYDTLVANNLLSGLNDPDYRNKVLTAMESAMGAIKADSRRIPDGIRTMLWPKFEELYGRIQTARHKTPTTTP